MPQGELVVLTAIFGCLRAGLVVYQLEISPFPRTPFAGNPGFREWDVPEARFPRRTLSGNLVNKASVQPVDPKTSMKARSALHKDLRQKVVRAMVVFGFSEPVRTIHGQPL